MKKYCLSDFKEEDINNAKKYFKDAYLGLLRTTLDDKIDDVFEKSKNIIFGPADTLTFTFIVETIGNDLLAALGCSMNIFENPKWPEEEK